MVSHGLNQPRFAGSPREVDRLSLTGTAKANASLLRIQYRIKQGDEHACLDILLDPPIGPGHDVPYSELVFGQHPEHTPG